MAPADDDAGSIRHDDVGPAIGMMDHADGFRHGLLLAWRAASYHARITFLSNPGKIVALCAGRCRQRCCTWRGRLCEEAGHSCCCRRAALCAPTDLTPGPSSLPGVTAFVSLG